MAQQKLYATRDFKHPRYSTRMLRAGDPVELDGPTARLYTALGAVTDKKPSARRPQLDHDSDGKEGGSKTAGGDLKALRAEYREVVGKQAFNGWDAATLREKMKAARK